jgi:hypothetical protein
MTDASLIAGTQAPPAVHEPITAAIRGMPCAHGFGSGPLL